MCSIHGVGAPSFGIAVSCPTMAAFFRPLSITAASIFGAEFGRIPGIGMFGYFGNGDFGLFGIWAFWKSRPNSRVARMARDA